MCSPIFLDNVAYWHFDLIFFFLHCPQEQDGLLCPFPHLYVRGRTFFYSLRIVLYFRLDKKSATTLGKL